MYSVKQKLPFVQSEFKSSSTVFSSLHTTFGYDSLTTTGSVAKKHKAISEGLYKSNFFVINLIEF